MNETSNELDLLGYQEQWENAPKETFADYLRGTDDINREQLVRVPTDGSMFIWNAPFKPLSVDIINSTGQTLNLADETGDVINVSGGSFVTVPINGSHQYRFQLVSADNTNRACYCIFYRYRRNVAGASAAGGAATSVSISGPLDGSGNVKTALETPLPAGANTIGTVDVGNFPATQNVAVTAALPAGANLLGQVEIQGNVGNAQQDAAGDFYVAERATPNWATSQLTTVAGAQTLAVARGTRSKIVIRNLDATNSVYIGPTTVTTTNGVVLKPGESRTFYTQTLLQVIPAAGTPTVEIDDYWY